MQELQKAIVVEEVGGPFSFKQIQRPTPTLQHDILIRVKAVALNPVDLKVKNGNKGGEKQGARFEPDPRVVGFDGAGVVEALGPGAHNFEVGDEVWWAGNSLRQGSFQQFQLVDERLVSQKPKSLSFEQAASLPLTSITAYEALKERMNVQPGRSILITAGAGGVGSIATQLAHHWGLRVISSVSREETATWTRAHGADVTVDHKKGIAQSFAEQGLEPVTYCLNTFGEQLLGDIVKVVAPFGHICSINGNISANEVPAIAAMFPKVISYHYEFMFGKAVHKVNEQSVGNILKEVAALVDNGKIVHTMQSNLPWTEVTKGYELLASGAAIGKVVLTIDDDVAIGRLEV